MSDVTREGARVLWIAVVAALVAAGIVALPAVVRESELGEVHWQIMGSFLAGLLCGGTALAATRLLERAQLRAVALPSLAAAPAAFAVFAVALWSDAVWDRHAETFGKVVITALLVVVTALLASTGALAVDRGHRAAWAVFLAACAFLAAADVVALAALWSRDPDDVGGDSRLVDDVGRALVALFSAAILAYLLAPAVQRASKR